MKNRIALLLLSGFLFFSNSTHALTVQEAQDQQTTVLEQINKAKAVASSPMRKAKIEITKAFQDSLEFLLTIAQDQELEKNQKTQFILLVTEKTGELHELVAAPFEDVRTFSFRYDPQASKVQNFFNKAFDTAAVIFQGWTRDIAHGALNIWDNLRFRSFPLRSDDQQRSEVLRTTAKDISEAIREIEARNKLAKGSENTIRALSEQDRLALASLAELIADSRDSEIMLNRRVNNLQRWLYIAIGGLFAYAQPIELAIERTWASPITTFFGYTLIGLTFSRIRTTNTGLKYGVRANRIRKHLFKLETKFNFKCSEELKGGDGLKSLINETD